MKKILPLLVLAMAWMGIVSADAAVSITKTQGWFESGYVTWTPVSGQTYKVYYRPEGGSYTQLDNELVRNYGSYGRADMVGLKAGKYQFKVEASDGTSAESDVFTATAYDRSGFAHVGMSGGIGAYKNDGTLKDGAKVLYVYANNAKTISTTVKTGSKATNIETATGLQSIINLYQKGYDTTPLDIRIIGTIKAADMDEFGSKAEGLQVKGKGNYSEMPITIEGIGDDATISGFGILVRYCHATEFRNFAIMLCLDDCMSLDTGNSNVWIHNMDFFYGNAGKDSDQAKGDGTVDIKAKSMNCTVSYNHFYDSGKSSLGGMDSDEQSCWHTYHHNWFDHSDSRHIRIRSQFFHMYNNYYDGNSKYGVGATTGGSALVEANYFRNCKYPMLSSMQGTDAEGDGTFSGEDGGVIKAYNNYIQGEKKIQYYTDGQTDGKWDAVLVTDRDAEVSATAYSGGSSYNNEADNAARTLYVEDKIDDPEQVPTIVRGELGAGRMNHGDFTWTFNNSVQDENYDVITELKTALQNYKSTLVGFFEGTTSINNGGATETVNGGDGKGMDQATNDAYKPSWVAGGGSSSTDDPSTPVVSDYVYDFAGKVGSTDGTNCSEFTAASSAKLASSTTEYLIIKPKSGDTFKNGDVVTVTGSCGSKDKVMGIYLNTTATKSGSAVCNSAKGEKSKSYTVTGTLTLTEDADVLYIFRYDGTSTTITGLKIGHATSTGISEIATSAAKAGKMYSLDGRQIFAPVRGQIYIMNGKKYLLSK